MNVRRFLLLAVLAFSALGLTSGPSSAATYHVSPLGSNTPPYDTYAKAATTIAPALLASGGYRDTVLIHAGTYVIDTVHHVPSGLTLAGVGMDSVTIDWDDHLFEGQVGLIFALGKDNEVFGVKMRYPRGSGGNQSIFALSVFAPDTLRVHDCVFQDLSVIVVGDRFLEVHDCVFHCGYISSGGLYVGTAPARIHNNRFYGNTTTSEGLSIRYTGFVEVEDNVFGDLSVGRLTGVFVDHVTHATIRNNLFLNTTAPVYWLFASGIIENNTMVMATGVYGGWPLHYGIPVELRWYETLTVRNNACVDFQAPWDFGNDALGSGLATGPIYFVHNTFWPPRDTMWIKWPQSNPDSVIVIDSANVNAHPLFAEESLFELQYGSPLIDAGDPAVLDVDGSRSDIGWLGGPGGRTYPYVDLPPLAPDMVAISGEGRDVRLGWSRGHGTDLRGYRLNRGFVPGFWSVGAPILAEVPVSDTSWIDLLPDSEDSAFYVVTAVDLGGHESPPSREVRYLVAAHPANRPPVIQSIPEQSVNVGDTLSLLITATDPDGDTLTLSAAGAPVNAIFTDLGGGRGVFEFAPDTSQVGQHVVVFVAGDGEMADSESVVVSVLLNDSTEKPNRSRILKAFPNPTNGQISVVLTIAQSTRGEMPVQIAVLDILGRRVATTYAGVLTPGEHTIACDLSSGNTGKELASGVYLLQLRVGTRVHGPPAKIALLR
jgi:hypothetical protein